MLSADCTFIFSFLSFRFMNILFRSFITFLEKYDLVSYFNNNNNNNNCNRKGTNVQCCPAVSHVQYTDITIPLNSHFTVEIMKKFCAITKLKWGLCTGGKLRYFQRASSKQFSLVSLLSMFTSEVVCPRRKLMHENFHCFRKHDSFSQECRSLSHIHVFLFYVNAIPAACVRTVPCVQSPGMQTCK